jgi:2-C-methyl-D-erythritol 4-phosphate cytidylyltransferase
MSIEMKIAVILPAAGQSKRFAPGAAPGSKSVSKLDADLDGRPVLLRSVELFAGRPQVTQIIVAADPDTLDAFKFRWADKLALVAGVKIVAGGKKERWETVHNAMKAVAPDVTHIAVHDAARPVTDPALIDRVFEAAARFSAVIPGQAVSATVKRAEAKPAAEPAADPLDAILGGAGKQAVEAYRVTETVPRSNLWLIQTPQVFERKLLEKAYKQVTDGKVQTDAITDDAGLIEALGEAVVVVPGDPLNVKITVAEDMRFALAVQLMRSGRSAVDRLGPKRQHPTWAQFGDE